MVIEGFGCIRGVVLRVDEEYVRETKVAEAAELLWYVDNECGWLLKRTTVCEEWRKEEKETGGEEEKGFGGTKMQVGAFDELVVQGTITVTPIRLAALLSVIPSADRQG